MRRRAVLGTLAGVLSGAATGCVGAPIPGQRNADDRRGTADDGPAPGTWPQVGYDAGKTRHVPDARGPRDGASVAWSALGDRPVYPPVVGREGLYLTEAWTGGAALSLARGDGGRRWTNRSPPPVRWAPALHGDRLLALSRAEGNVVRLHALEADTGERAWVREAGVTASAGEHPPIGPTVRGGSAYVASNRGVIALDVATGDVEWAAELGPHVVEVEGGPTWRTDWATPAVTRDRVFTFDRNAGYGETRAVHAVDRATGDPEWTASLDVGDRWYLAGHVVAGDGRVFVSALRPRVSADAGDATRPGAGRLLALEADSGAVVWDWARPGRTLGPPAHAGGTLYVAEWDGDAETGRLHALGAADGRVDWTVRVDGAAVRSPTVAAETVYVAQGTGLAAVAREDGARRWQLDVGARAGPPVLVGGAIYLQTAPGHDWDSEVLAISEP